MGSDQSDLEELASGCVADASLPGIRERLIHLVGPQLVCWALEQVVAAGGSRTRVSGKSLTCSAAAAKQCNGADVAVVACMPADCASAQGHCTRAAPKVLLVTSGEFSISAWASAERFDGVFHTSRPALDLLRSIDKLYERSGGTDALKPNRIHEDRSCAQTRALQPQRTTEPNLTRREREVVAAITSNVAWPAKVVADKLRLSEHTLRNHLSSIYEKLGVRGRVALYAYVRDHAEGQFEA